MNLLRKLRTSQLVLIVSFFLGTIFIVSAGVLTSSRVNKIVLTSIYNELNSTTRLLKNLLTNNLKIMINDKLDDYLNQVEFGQADVINNFPAGVHYFDTTNTGLEKKSQSLEFEILKNASQILSGKQYSILHIAGNTYFVKKRIVHFKDSETTLIISISKNELLNVVDVSSLENLLVNTKIGNAGYPFVFDTKGNVIMHPKFSRENLLHVPSVKRMCEMKNGSFYYDWKNPGDLEWKKKFVVFESIDEMDWIIGSAVLKSEINAPIEKMQKIFLIVTIIFIAIAGILSIFFGNLINAHFMYFIKCFKKGAREDLYPRMNLIGPKDIIELKFYFNEFMEQLEERDKTIKNVSQQLAHDIRSPLAALTMAISQLQEISEEPRLLIRSAVQRIHDIANDLAGKKSQTAETQNAAQQDDLSVHLLSSLIDPLISEKRLQHRSKLNVNIEANLDGNSYGLFAKIQPAEFKRVLSNLINNAVEGIESEGRVSVNLFIPSPALQAPSPLRGGGRGEGTIQITITDTGKGIPPEVLPKLMQRGETHGKEGGSGLGLFHARESVEKWGGTMTIESTVGVGTTVTLTLPRQAPPPWFVPQIDLQPGMTVVILDDDNSIHQIWKGRFENCHPERSEGSSDALSVFHFSTPDNFIEWYRGQKDLRNFLVLCDFEFLGCDKNGLDVIRELQIQDHTLLVTSRFEDENIRRDCEELGVQLIPKNLAGFVPIKIKNPSPALWAPSPARGEGKNSPSPIGRGQGEGMVIDAILIDDDDLVHMNWNLAAKRLQKNLRTYFDPQNFLQEITNFKKDTPIYVDSSLANGVKGEDIAWMLSKKGFSHLYLATGYQATDFSAMPWIKDVVGKAPPWS